MKKFFFMAILSILIAACGNAQATITDNGKPGQIKVVVYQDTNGNGTQDSDEKGFSERVLLSQKDTCPPQTKNYSEAVTNENGEMIFADLKPGKYCVAYYGGRALTSQIAVTVNLSSEQQAEVFYGVLP
jgi:uncharacterized protein (DUF2141 family)